MSFTGFHELFSVTKINKEVKKYGWKEIQNKTMNIAVIGAAILWPLYWCYTIISAYSNSKRIKAIFPDMKTSIWVMKTIICGGRYYDGNPEIDYAYLDNLRNALKSFGNSRGADQVLGEKWARSRKLQLFCI